MAHCVVAKSQNCREPRKAHCTNSFLKDYEKVARNGVMKVKISADTPKG